MDHNCSPYAACKFDSHINNFACVCLPGFQGDGYSCEASDGYKGTGVPLPTCLLEVCWCPAGFRFEKQTHQCISDDGPVIPAAEDTDDGDEEDDCKFKIGKVGYVRIRIGNGIETHNSV